MGGTFNPIHIGHLLLAETARDFLHLDEICFIPNGCSYMKNSQEVLDKYLRYEMTRLAILDNPAFTISDIEITRAGNSYTYETLLALREKEPEAEFYFIVGADTLFKMESWKNPDIIFQNCMILAAVRDNMTQKAIEEQMYVLAEKYDAGIRLLPMKEYSISSTDIRNRIRNNQSIRYLVPDSVITFIDKNHLYVPGTFKTEV